MNEEEEEKNSLRKHSNQHTTKIHSYRGVHRHTPRIFLADSPPELSLSAHECYYTIHAHTASIQTAK